MEVLKTIFGQNVGIAVIVVFIIAVIEFQLAFCYFMMKKGIRQMQKNAANQPSKSDNLSVAAQ